MDLIQLFTILSLLMISAQALYFSRMPHTHNKQQLTGLYNQPISSIQEYRRPLNIKPILGYNVAGKLNDWGINHRGQVATLQNGERHLVHKGPGFGHHSNTVVVNANQMSRAWTAHGSPVSPGAQSSRLGDLVKAGGKDYKTFRDNCIHGACRMRERFEKGK